MRKQTWQQWARAVGRDESSPSNLGPHSLGALTGQDTYALNSIVAALELYASGDEAGQRGALAAIRALLLAMQGSTRWIARELIPFVLNWGDRERLWPLIEPSQVPLVDEYGDPGENPLERSHPFDEGPISSLNRPLSGRSDDP